MGQVYVIRKEITPAVSVGGGGGLGMQMLYTPGMENSGPQLVSGVNEAGVRGLQQNPMTNQYEATPQMDESGKNEIGVYEGDKYGARSLNINPKFNQNLAFGPVAAEQAPIHEAQKKVFERGAKYGQFGADFGRGLAGGLGLLAGAVSLANAGASGQDALTGGLGAAQMGSMTYQQGKKPLSEAGGEIGAQIGARGVKVETPQVASPTPVAVAPPTPETHTEEEMISYQGKIPVMTTGKHGQPVRYGSSNPYERAIAQRGAKHRLNQQMGRNVDPGTEAAEYNPPMGGDVKVLPTGIVAGQGGQTALASGNLAQDRANIQRLNNPPEVAEPTTNNQAEITGTTIANELNTQSKLPGVEGTANEIKNATQTPEGSDPENPAAKEMSGKKPSSTDQSMVKMVGVIGSKKIVGVI